MRIGPQLYHIRRAGKDGHNWGIPVVHRQAQYGSPACSVRHISA
jgi:hypothetical protein